MKDSMKDMMNKRFGRTLTAMLLMFVFAFSMLLSEADSWAATNNGQKTQTSTQASTQTSTANQGQIIQKGNYLYYQKLLVILYEMMQR